MDVEVLQRFFQNAAICLPCLCQYFDLPVSESLKSDATEEGLKGLLAEAVQKYFQQTRFGKQFSSPQHKQTALANLLQALTDKQFPTHACTNCLNTFHHDNINALIDTIARKLAALSSSASHNQHKPIIFDEVHVQLGLPPVIDASRIATRTMVTYSADKTIAFSAFDVILLEILALRLQEKGITMTNKAKVIVQIEYRVYAQLDVCTVINPEFRNKKVKRKYGVPNHNSAAPTAHLGGGADTDIAGEDAVVDTEHGVEVLRHNIDSLIMWMKNLTKQGVDKMYAHLVQFLQLQTTRNQYDIDVYFAPIYIFGRYCKFARDVPQSPWSISEDAPNTNADGEVLDGPKETIFVAKGRNSIEEIIASEIKAICHASICKLHACGREDIDVRCLGNGRPFALEVMHARLDVTQAMLNQVVCNVNGRRGLNVQKDIVIKGPMMTCDRGIWENMQSEAEEKKKGYRCVVYVKHGLQRAGRELLEALCRQCRSGSEVDDEGKPCLTITQRTPLRVMHRRSLMDRIRYVYDLDVCVLNAKFFVLSLVTSAGAYVKEFVHGDLGRTRPNIASVLHSPAEILQLDVIRLFDDFEKYSLLPKDMEGLMSEEMKQQLRDEEEEEKALEASWQHLKAMRQPVYRLKA